MPLGKPFIEAARNLLDEEDANVKGVLTVTREWCEGTNQAWESLKTLITQSDLDDVALADHLEEIKAVKGNDRRLEKLWTDHAEELNGLLRNVKKRGERATGV